MADQKTNQNLSSSKQMEGSLSTSSPSQFTSRMKGKDIYAILIFLGILSFFITLLNQKERAWSSYLIGFFYFTSLALGGLFFTSLQNVTRALWSVSIRRFTESLTSFLTYGLIAALLFILVGAPHLYEWISPHAIEEDPLIQHKIPYLNPFFLSIRWILFFTLWIFFSHRLIRLSLAQDSTMPESLLLKLKKGFNGLNQKETLREKTKTNKETEKTKREKLEKEVPLKAESIKLEGIKRAKEKTYSLKNQSKIQPEFFETNNFEKNNKKLSAKGKLFSHQMVKPSLIFILVFVISYTLFSFDALMSLEPHWFSTIFGVYTFSGLFQSTMAFVILLVIYKMKTQKETGEFITVDHLHDLGKYLFTFTIFWAYIAFSQFMLIWYANLPEETFFFVPRLKNSWIYVSLSLVVFKFAVPFLALLPRWAKRSPSHLAAVSILVLIMQYVDIYWLVYPHYSEEKVIFSFSEIFIFLGFLGVFLFSIHNFLDKNHPIPYGDPNLSLSKKHHVI